MYGHRVLVHTQERSQYEMHTCKFMFWNLGVIVQKMWMRTAQGLLSDVAIPVSSAPFRRAPVSYSPTFH